VIEGWPRTGGAIPIDVYATCFFYHSTDLLAKMAAAIGRTEEVKDYAHLAEEIRAAFNAAFVKPDGRIEGNTQAGYALALHFGMLPETLRGAALKYMIEGIEAYKGHVSTGFLGTNAMMQELVKMGRADVAYRLLTNRTVPSWGYMVDHGATTMWERWDCYVEERGLQDPGMNSYNHYAFGAVGEWMHRHILGINPDPDRPGFKHFIIRPRVGGGLTWAKGSYHSIYGEIGSAWKLEDGTFTLAVTIPANTTATVYVPSKDGQGVTESNRPAAGAEGAEFLGMEDGCAVFALGSGRYAFVAR